VTTYWWVDRALPGIVNGVIMAAALAVLHLLMRRFIRRTTSEQTATITGSAPTRPGSVKEATMTETPATATATPPPPRNHGGLYAHIPHPHIAARAEAGPVKIADQIPQAEGKSGLRRWYTRGNAWLAVKVTAGVGSMTCAWLFCLLAIAGLPTALQPGNIGFLFWFSSDLLQLTLLSVIIVGQNIQASASDKRSEQTYRDAEAVLAEALKIQEHLAVQDDVLTRLAAAMQAKDAAS